MTSADLDAVPDAAPGAVAGAGRGAGVAPRVATPVQGELAGMPPRLFAASPSRLAAWLDCPRRYRLRYLDLPRPRLRPQRAHTTVGTVTHAVLRDFWDLPTVARTPDRAAALVETHWVPAGFRDDEQARRWRERVRRQILAYLGSIGPARWSRPVGIERTVAFTTRRLAFSGRIDRLDDRDGELVVVDYKTGRRPPTHDDARTSLALALYAIGAARVFRRDCVRVELHHIPTGAVAAHEHTATSLARKVAEADSIARDLATAGRAYAAHGPDDPMFAPRLTSLCAWCDVRAHCAEGAAHLPEKSGWAGLPGEDRPDAS